MAFFFPDLNPFSKSEHINKSGVEHQRGSPLLPRCQTRSQLSADTAPALPSFLQMYPLLKAARGCPGGHRRGGCGLTLE